MKTIVLVTAIAATAGCASLKRTGPAESLRAERRYEMDTDARPDRVPQKEAEQVAAQSFPWATTECRGDGEDDRTGAWIESSVHGSFTGAGVRETMYSAQLSRCNDLPSAPKQHFILVYLGGVEVWRAAAPEAVKAVDVDGDGKDEWLEVYNQCRGECTTEAWIQGFDGGKAVTLAHEGMK